MKKILFLVILALSIHAVAQKVSFSANKVLNNTLFEKIQQAQQSNKKQVIDTVYQWSWKTYLNSWGNLDYKTYNTFDANFNRLSEVRKQWNGVELLFQSQNTYTYDANNNQLSATFGIDYRSKEINTFDANNNRIEQINQKWEDPNWVNQSKYSNDYDINKNKTKETRQTWDGTQWVNVQFLSYTYDANNNPIYILFEAWDGTKYINLWNITYSYDTNNNVESIIMQIWDVTKWVNLQKEIPSYNGNKNLLSYLVQLWDGSLFVNYSQDLYTYDANNNKTSKTTKRWTNGAWILISKETTNYDANNFVAYTTKKNFLSDGITITNGDSTVNYYRTVVAGVSSPIMSGATITVYPNPTTSHIQVSGIEGKANVSLFGIDGKLLLSKEFIGNESISVSMLPKGLYLVKVTTKEGVVERKLVKK